MPGINVIDADGDVQRFPDATTWHVDDRGQLHVKSNTTPIASFARDKWQGASTNDEMGEGVKRVTLEDLLVELTAIRKAVVPSRLDVAARAGRR